MDSVLIVSSSDKGTELLWGLLKMGEDSLMMSAKSGSEARRIMVQNHFDVVVIVTPLSDEFGHELGLSVAEATTAGVILIVKQDIADAVSSKVEDYGVLVVEKPISRVLFYQALKLVKASRRRILGLKNENLQLQNKIAEIRIVDRAKCALIQYLNMNETQAHKYIEKQAMDMQLTRKAIAENILKAYE